MNKTLPIGICFFFFALGIMPTLSAQAPVNDNVCNALEIVGPALSISNLGATAENGEDSILPPPPPPPNVPGTIGLCDPGGWCDQIINHSLWFKFVAPNSTAVLIDACGSDFDTQMALFEVGDCADFSSFNLIWAMDDRTGCGIGNGLSSSIRIECLNPGQEYYVVVDDWRENASQLVDTGTVVISVEEVPKIDAGLSIQNPNLINPLCPGGSDGAIDITIITGVEPISYEWSIPATSQDIDNLPAGTYTVTITDFCQNTLVRSFDIDDPTDPEPITLGDYPVQVVHPGNCGSGQYGGQVSIPIATGTPPFSYQWAHGDSTGLITGLADGAYTVTISDACPDPDTLVQTFYVGASAGPDIRLPETCQPVTIGLPAPASTANNVKFTYNSDQVAGGNVHCRFQNPNDPNAPTNGSISVSTHWRPFRMSDFDVTDDTRLTGVEFFVQNNINTLASARDAQPGLPMEFRLFLANTMELDAEDLLLSPIDSVFTFLPSTPADGSFSSFIVPFDAEDIGPDDIIVVSVRTRGEFGLGHFFTLGANLTDTPGSTTYLSECGLDGIRRMDFLTNTLSFENETIMNLIFGNPAEWTYEWEGNVDDKGSATPVAQGEESSTYAVTITNADCNVSYTDEVSVSCWKVGTEDLLPLSLLVSPNPGDGFFQIQQQGDARIQDLRVFDLRGKEVYAEVLGLGKGEQKSLDLQHLSSGIYLAEFSQEAGIQHFKLLIQ